jgi:3'-phosphoadenosine 5'-phosphosulfate (PAPS) 3'-phosphatase
MPAAETDGELATRLATQTGHLLLELREKLFAQGASTWDVKDAGDAVAQRFLAQEFATHRPDDAVLSEEGREDPRRFEPIESGSSIRSTARASSASPDASTGRSTSRSGRAPNSAPPP